MKLTREVPIAAFLLDLIAEPSSAEIRDAARLVYGWYMGGEFPEDHLAKPLAESAVAPGENNWLAWQDRAPSGMQPPNTAGQPNEQNDVVGEGK